MNVKNFATVLGALILVTLLACLLFSVKKSAEQTAATQSACYEMIANAADCFANESDADWSAQDLGAAKAYATAAYELMGTSGFTDAECAAMSDVVSLLRQLTAEQFVNAADREVLFTCLHHFASARESGEDGAQTLREAAAILERWMA